MTAVVPPDISVNCFTSDDCSCGQVGSMSLPAVECCVDNGGNSFQFNGECLQCFG